MSLIFMNFKEIVDATNQGKYVVWIDDKQNGELTPTYIEQHFVAFVDTPDDGYDFCRTQHEEERKKHGKSITRYRISRGKEEYVCLEDRTAEDMTRVVENLPMSTEDIERVIRDLKS